MNSRLIAQKYKETNGKLQLSCQKTIKSVEHFEDLELGLVNCRLEEYLYQSEKLEELVELNEEALRLTFKSSETFKLVILI